MALLLHRITVSIFVRNLLINAWAAWVRAIGWGDDMHRSKKTVKECDQGKFKDRISGLFVLCNCHYSIDIITGKPGSVNDVIVRREQDHDERCELWTKVPICKLRIAFIGAVSHFRPRSSVSSQSLWKTRTEPIVYSCSDCSPPTGVQRNRREICTDLKRVVSWQTLARWTSTSTPTWGISSFLQWAASSRSTGGFITEWTGSAAGKLNVSTIILTNTEFNILCNL